MTADLRMIRQLLELSDDCRIVDDLGWRPLFDRACRRYDLIRDMTPDDPILRTIGTAADVNGLPR
ncbi:hypothetical protein [Bifidobacterium sp. SO1]|uniref:hypothetical protein n=1 Tax=Bifidobacterium sp. SO1 TaxID=2809029 RepID=UPI001BDCEE8E|nr:hypothetical protein [Bifidobacterium sp. SO1]MBT1161820.1 hypothetical protein [Bifidobacterium sp. SO1]